jgi:hypothetical protein
MIYSSGKGPDSDPCTNNENQPDHRLWRTFDLSLSRQPLLDSQSVRGEFELGQDS